MMAGGENPSMELRRNSLAFFINKGKKIGTAYTVTKLMSARWTYCSKW